MTDRPARPSGTSSRILFLFLLVALTLAVACPAAAFAAGWEIQLQGEDTWINQVKAVSATEAWVIRDDAPKVMHTTDGGASWYGADNTGLGGDLYGMFFYDDQHGWISEHNYSSRQGHVAYTTNGGTDWTVVNVSSAGDYISFGSASVGWMGGMNPRGKVLYTNDGGATWTEQTFQTPQSDSVNGVSAVSSTTCWMATGDSVFLTTDSGTTWPETFIALPAGAYISCISATDSTHAWVAGGSTGGRFIMATNNGGSNWTTQYSGSSSSDFNAIDMLPDNLHGWAVSGDGLVFTTTDGGVDWNAQVSGIDTILLDVDFVNATNGWACGTSGTILHTGDGGGPADTTPPITTPGWTDRMWMNVTSLDVPFTATDAGVGPWRIYAKLSGAAAWSWLWPTGSTVPISPLAEGENQVLYYAVDKAGNTETQKTFTINIDTKAPKATGLKNATVRKGKRVALKYRISDPAPNGGKGWATIRVMTTKGKVLKTIEAEDKKVNVALTATYKCKLKKGKYKYAVVVGDQTGNFIPKFAYAKLIVK
jgi:photosystem II stability/assembly factor-like uncharacterized protein